MIFIDSNKVYEVSEIERLLKADDLTSIEKVELNLFSRLMYEHYKTIRDCCNPKKCKKLNVTTVRERLNDSMYQSLVKRFTKLNVEQAVYVINYCAAHYKNFI